MARPPARLALPCLLCLFAACLAGTGCEVDKVPQYTWSDFPCFPYGANFYEGAFTFAGPDLTLSVAAGNGRCCLLVDATLPYEVSELTQTELVEKGYSGARVAEIADKAGVDKRLLFYYFGTKQGLPGARARGLRAPGPPGPPGPSPQAPGPPLPLTARSPVSGAPGGPAPLSQAPPFRAIPT